jgi:glycosyltransferase involved in cell wall biosynthesis
VHRVCGITFLTLLGLRGMMASEGRRPIVDFLVGERDRPSDAMDRAYANFKKRVDPFIDGRELDYAYPKTLGRIPAMMYLTRYLYTYRAWMKRRKDSIVQVHNQRLGMLLHLNDFSPSIIICHDIIERVMREYWAGPSYRAFIWLYTTGTMKADIVVTPSRRTAEDIRQYFSTNPPRVEVIHHGVDRTRFHPMDRRIFLRNFGLPEDRRYMLYVGSEQPRKNVPAVVRTFIRAKKEIPDLVFLKVGRADEVKGHPVHEQLLKELSEAGLGNQAFFFDFVPDDLIPAAYSAADVFVFPSLYEGFGMPVLEAMACGTPVVTSNTTAIPEVAENAAILVPPTDEDAILESTLRVLRDDELRADLTAKGRARAEELNWDKAARKLLELYRQLNPR